MNALSSSAHTGMDKNSSAIILIAGSMAIVALAYASEQRNRCMMRYSFFICFRITIIGNQDFTGGI